MMRHIRTKSGTHADGASQPLANAPISPMASNSPGTGPARYTASLFQVDALGLWPRATPPSPGMNSTERLR